MGSYRYLDVGGCQEVTDIGVQALAGSCHKLSYLDLSSTATSRRGYDIIVVGSGSVTIHLKFELEFLNSH